MLYKKIINEKTNRATYITRVDDKAPTKFTSVKNIPGNILKLLETQDEVDDALVTPETPLRECVVCDTPTKMYRLINQQTVAVCEEHYHNKSLGELAQAARLKQEKLDEEEEQHKENGVLQGQV